MTAPRLPKVLRRREAVERAEDWTQWDPPEELAARIAAVLPPYRCHCGRPVPPSSACGDCCAEHESTATPNRLPEHLRTDDINDYLRQKGEL